MICALCHEEKELCDSHVISKFNYKPLKEDEGRFYVVSADPDLNNQVVQDGVKQKLLCRDCEDKRNTWETYFSSKWHRGEFFSEAYPHAVTGLDYAKVKLYQMSTLFLASVSDDRLFEEVELLTERQEQLREMLLSESPGPPAEFGCMMDALIEQQIDPRTLVAKAVTKEKAGIRVHQFIFAGFMWAFVDGDTDLLKDTIKAHFLGKDGRLVIRGKPVRDIEFLMGTFRRLDELGKLDDI